MTVIKQAVLLSGCCDLHFLQRLGSAHSFGGEHTAQFLVAVGRCACASTRLFFQANQICGKGTGKLPRSRKPGPSESKTVPRSWGKGELAGRREAGKSQEKRMAGRAGPHPSKEGGGEAAEVGEEQGLSRVQVNGLK